MKRPPRSSRSLPFLLLISASPLWAGNLAESDQIVIVMDHSSLDLTRLHRLEDELDVIAKQTDSGELDGDEVTPGRKASIYLKSADTDRLTNAIRAALMPTISRATHALAWAAKCTRPWPMERLLSRKPKVA